MSAAQSAVTSKTFSDPFARSRRREASVVGAESSGVSMAGMPEEVLRTIVGFLDEEGCGAARATCRRLYVVVPEPAREEKT
jgi:hypothetical protein